jgi:electron transport complex protein RnfG
MKEMLNNGLRSALIMLAFSLGFTALMAGTYQMTRNIVLKNEEAAKTALIAQVLPVGSFDNDLNRDAHAQPDKDDGSQFYLARKAGQITAAVFEATAPDGYAGKIALLVGVDADGKVLGVRVVTHKETPGLGDYIDIAKSAWIKGFDGKSMTAPTPERWRVKKDGGDFDYTAGATISPRAVVKAVKLTLEYAAAHRQEIWSKS